LEKEPVLTFIQQDHNIMTTNPAIAILGLSPVAKGTFGVIHNNSS
jgi:hypothetical protein